MNREDKFTLFVYCNFLVLLSTTICININKQYVNIADETLRSAAFSVGITILNQRIIWKDDIEFVTEFPYFLGHPVHTGCSSKFICLSLFNSYPLALKRVLIRWNSDWSKLIKYFCNNSTLHSSTLLLLNSTYWKMQNMKTTFSF